MKKMIENRIIRHLILFIFICIGAVLFTGGSAYAAAPVLYFSDITNGPKTGLGDGIGSGAIVTIWGANLGSSQGPSTIYVGGVPAAHVYYWGNADGSKAAGPADLYAYHKMQTISFSIPASVADGTVTMKVAVGGVDSNTLPFYVRTGSIKHVKVSGTDQSSCGAWSSPCRSVGYVTNNVMGLGDTWYVGDGITEGHAQINGGREWATATNSCAVIAYPNSDVQVNGVGDNYNTNSAYWVFSKLILKSDSVAITTMKYIRIIGNEITQISCADGMAGAIWGQNWCPSGNTGNMASGVKAFGNYIHDYGCETTSKFQHVFYITPRTGCIADSPELGWNYLRDNKAPHALHVYDEGAGGDFNGTLKIHDNVVVNQVGRCIDVLGGGTTGFHMPVEIYNNLCINAGLTTTAITNSYPIITWQGSSMYSQIKFYNNTIYGYGVVGGGALLDIPTAGNVIGAFAGTAYVYNNIFIDTKNNPWSPSSGGFVNPTTSRNNLWYSTAESKSPPSWDTNPLNSNPLFTNVASNNFSLQLGSPAMDAGADTSPTVIRDILGTSRPQGSLYDIGAFEYDAGSSPPLTHTVTPSAGIYGSISPNTAQTVNDGSTMQFTITPSNGYAASVGGSCGGSLSGTIYTTNAITANCTVAATFSAAPTYTIGGAIANLAGSITLTDANAGSVTVSANTFVLPNGLITGANYNVTVSVQPAGRLCTVSNGSGTVGYANVANVSVSCVSSYTVGGSLSGFSGNGTVTIRNNGGDDLHLASNGAFTFPTALVNGSNYLVSIPSQPSGQTCTISNGSGSIAGANITSLAISCVTSGPTTKVPSTVQGISVH